MASYRELDADARLRASVYAVIAVGITVAVAIATPSVWAYLGVGLACGVVVSIIELRLAFKRQRR
ncbi:MAG: hypothetical protein JWO17_3353 [Actinomycetia bacterium]|nr:hypothetical protein [Actinomycetes bacterium]